MAKSAIKAAQNISAQQVAQKSSQQPAAQADLSEPLAQPLDAQSDAKPHKNRKSKPKKSTDQPAVAPSAVPSTTLGDYALTLIGKQYQRLIKQEAGVLKDTDPESLHQMRVNSRRLRAVLELFESVVKLPKPAQAKRIQSLAKVLGSLRDLDVQIEALREQYRPLISVAEQPATDQAIARLQAQRKKAFKQVERLLANTKYSDLKTAYENWLAQPLYQPLAQLPLATVMPDLLVSLVSELLLHPSWCARSDQGELLHELRKACKNARYQAEFFADFYGADFQGWVSELKQLQEDLGTVQDAHVLLDLLELEPEASPDLFQVIQNQRQTALSGWEQLQAKYTDAAFRSSLYQMVLSPA